MKRPLPIILITLGGFLLFPIIGLHLAALGMSGLFVVAPSIAIAVYGLAIIGLVLFMSGLAVLVLRRRSPLP